MLPSQGLFRSIPCPFFLAGFCERPHCSYRHCRSDIRIDRKLETEALNEPTASGDTVESTNAPTNEGIQNTPLKNYAASTFKEPVNKESPSNNNKSETEISHKELRTKRLKSTESSESSSVPSEPSRKRSRDSDSEDSSKRARLSKDSKDPEEMGQYFSKLIGSESAEPTKEEPSPTEINRKRDKRKKDELDLLVEEIEKCGKSPESRHKNRKNKKHKRRRRSSGDNLNDSNSSSTSTKKENKSTTDEKSKDDKSIIITSTKKDKSTEEKPKDDKSMSTSTKKENKSTTDEKAKDDKSRDEKAKDGKCKWDKPRRESEKAKEKSKSEKHREEDRKKRDDRKDRDSKKEREKSDDNKRKKDSKTSSSSSSPKDSKRPRKTSDSDDSSKRSDKSSPSTTKCKDGSASSSPKKSERMGSKDSFSSKQFSETVKDVLPVVENSVDTTNRFSALAENVHEESAYHSDIFEDSFDFNYPGGSDSEDDPEMVARECRELFENYKPEAESKPVTDVVDPRKEKEEDPDEGFCVVGKKRVAHGNAPKPSFAPAPKRAPPATSKNLHESMYKRLDDQSKKYTNSVTSLTNGSSGSTSPTYGARPFGKSRIAHVPNAGKLAQKPALTSTQTTSQVPSNSSSSMQSTASSVAPGQPGSLTYSQTAAKGVKREAHKPSANIIAKKGPVVFRDALNKTTKIPHSVRQQMLDKMFTEFSRILANEQVAWDTTLTKENELLDKCSTRQVYLSSGVSIISGLRKAGLKPQDNGQNTGPNRVVSHAEILSGSLEARNCSVRTAKKNDSIPVGSKLYRALRKYVMTEIQLEENGYPRPHPSGEPGRATARARPGEENSMTLRRRICDRCKKRYETTDDGEHIILEVCNYHWGRKYNVKARGGRGARENTFSCCGMDDDKIGCVTAVCHVSKCPVPISSQKGFVEAVLEEGSEELMGDDPWDVIGIDCEMVYTTHGNELARVTIVGADGKVLYDEIVKPTHKVLDCNTRFSGITFEDIDRAKRNITEIQAIILTHLRPNTIIIGHSLESDLLALRLKHDCVIDTTILYPHRMGPPKKRALKTLSVEILKKVIQEQLTGHDSAEDAQIAVELVLAKLKADNK